MTVHAASLHAADELARLAARRLADLERYWTRFSPESDLSYLNRRAGRGPVQVSEDLLGLVQAMRSVWRDTEGRCNPASARAMAAVGYVASFTTDRPSGPCALPSPMPSFDGVVVDEESGTVELPDGVALDPGSVGKGLAAGWLVDDALAAGASAVVVDVGGDVVLGGSIDGHPWEVAVADERRTGGALPVAVLSWEPRSGLRLAVATSSVTRRAWPGGHHVLDPLTGSPLAREDSAGCALAATAVLSGAGRDIGADAEAAATAFLVDSARGGGSAAAAHAAGAFVVAQFGDGSCSAYGYRPAGVRIVREVPA